MWEEISVSEYLSGRQASISQDNLSGLLKYGLSESLNPFLKMPAGLSITGFNPLFIPVNEKCSSSGYGTPNSMGAAWLS